MIALKYQRRRGVTAMLAMLYLVLFSTLALGFYATTTTAVQVSNNDVKITRALTAAESGIEFMNYHMDRLDIDHDTAPSALFETVYQKLKLRLEHTSNMPSTAKDRSIEKISGTGPSGQPVETIYIPARDINNDSTFIALSDGGEFRVEVKTIEGATTAEQVEVLVFGKYGGTNASRCVKINYANMPNPTKIFNYGVASKSGIVLDSNARIIGAASAGHGSILSTSSSLPAIELRSNAQVSGDLAVSSASSSAISMNSNASVGGEVRYGEEPPEFPTVDTSAFKQFAGNPVYGGTTVLVPGTEYNSATLYNVYIKAGTNPTFKDCTVQGVIYVEAPNHVTFDTQSSVTGAIVVDNDTASAGSPPTNKIEFKSNTALGGMDELPEADFSHFPAAMRSLTGSMILAPNFFVHFNSNFDSFGGSVVASQVEFDSNAIGTVKGTIINLDDSSVLFDSNSQITVESQGTAHYPAGVKFGSRYSPLPGTYEEIIQ